jgi:hypothetical protein
MEFNIIASKPCLQLKVQVVLPGGEKHSSLVLTFYSIAPYWPVSYDLTVFMVWLLYHCLGSVF